jgi:hypothetical protein
MIRSALLGSLCAFAALVALAPAASASSPWTPVPDPFTDAFVPANAGGGACSFPIEINTVSNSEHQITTPVGPPAPNGTTLTRVRGELAVSVSRLDNMGNPIKTIVRDISGPTDTTAFPNGTGIETETGNNGNAAGPHSFANTGEPVFFFTTGPTTLRFETITNPDGSTSRVLTSVQALKQESACDLLGG